MDDVKTALDELKEAVKVLDSVNRDDRWVVREDGICYFTSPDDERLCDLCFYEFASGGTRRIMDFGGLSAERSAVSPDGRAILYSPLDEPHRDLMLVKNFRQRGESSGKAPVGLVGRPHY